MCDVFERSRFPDIAQSIQEAFKELNAGAVYSDACDILRRELKDMDGRGSAAVKKHMAKNILPGYACYMALVDAGASRQRAADFVEAEICRAVSGMAALTKWMSAKSFAYPVFRFLFGVFFNVLYPPQGWTVQYIENSKLRIRISISSCLYREELSKRGAPELCRAFCQSDHACYDPLAPGVIFKRENTLATTGKPCDFCFERGCKPNEVK